MKSIKVHPVNSGTVILWGDNGNKDMTITKGQNCVATVIAFDKRQIWEVYPYKRRSTDTEYCCSCERNNVYIRLMPLDWKRIFGADIVKKAKDEVTE